MFLWGLRPSSTSERPRPLSSSGTFQGHTAHCRVPVALCVLERGSDGAGRGAVSSLRRADLSPASREQPCVSRMQRLSRRTLPGATFIYEALILTMATSIRWERNPDSKP